MNLELPNCPYKFWGGEFKFCFNHVIVGHLQLDFSLLIIFFIFKIQI